MPRCSINSALLVLNIPCRLTTRTRSIFRFLATSSDLRGDNVAQVELPTGIYLVMWSTVLLTREVLLARKLQLIKLVTFFPLSRLQYMFDFCT